MSLKVLRWGVRGAALVGGVPALVAGGWFVGASKDVQVMLALILLALVVGIWVLTEAILAGLAENRAAMTASIEEFREAVAAQVVLEMQPAPSVAPSVASIGERR